MNEAELIHRTKQFALRILKLAEALPDTIAGKAMSGQIIRAGTSVAANYRAACKGRSKADFVSKLGIVEEEADETVFWLEMIMEAELMQKNLVQDLYQEAQDITAIMAASRITAKKHN